MNPDAEVEVMLSWGAASHRGTRRMLNEDRFLATGSVFFVADGMGGHEAGEVASTAAVDAMRPLGELQVVTPEDVMVCLDDAQKAVRAISTDPGRGAGTTVTGVAIAEQEGMPYWLVTNVGDSRTYRYSSNILEQVSIDHSEVQEMVDAGMLTKAEALTHPRRHVVTRALGSREDPEPDFWYLPITAGDRMMVCSDGLTGELSNGQIEVILDQHPEPQNAADQLVRGAIAAGGRDNITVVVIDAMVVMRDADSASDSSGG